MRILIGAHIHTQNPRNPEASALVIENGCILAVGTDDQMLALAHSHSEIENMEGRFILPGLCDCHLHLLEYGNYLSKVNCETNTRAVCLERISQRAAITPPGKWILGHGWNHNRWAEGLGNARILDEISEVHPIYLTAKSLHAAWANSLALQLAGISADTPDPKGGKIARDSAGSPSGILIESAMQLVERVLPVPTLDENIRTLNLAQERLIEFGLTSVHDFDRWDCFSALQRMDKNHQLFLRVLKGIPQDHLDEVIAQYPARYEFSDHLFIGSLKLFSDGALGSRTAAMLSPYLGDPTNLGMLLMEADEIFRIGARAVQYGITIAIHAIGDRANRVVLDAFKHIRDFEKSHGMPHLRHRIEHVQLIEPADQKRMADLKIIASMQPLHATSDRGMAQRYWGERCADAYAWQSLNQKKVKIIFGSDAPVETPNPLLGLYASVTRKSVHAELQEDWFPHQCLTRSQALAAYTTIPAFASGNENRLGRIAPSYFADLIVLDKDPLTIPAEELINLKPSAVMITGQWVKRV